MNAKQMTAAFGLAATMLLGAGVLSFAAETPMTQEQKNNIHQSLFKTYAEVLKSPAVGADGAFRAVQKIRELALVNSQIATDAVPLLAKFHETTHDGIQSLEFESIKRLIDATIKEISDRWDVMVADVSCKSDKRIASEREELQPLPFSDWVNNGMRP